MHFLTHVTSSVWTSFVGVWKTSSSCVISSWPWCLSLFSSLTPLQQAGVAATSAVVVLGSVGASACYLKQAKILKIAKAQHLCNYDVYKPFKNFVWQLDSQKKNVYLVAKEKVSLFHDTSSSLFEDNVINVCEKVEPFGSKVSDFMVLAAAKGIDPVEGISLNIVTTQENNVVNLVSYHHIGLTCLDSPSIRIPEFTAHIVERWPGLGSTITYSPIPASWANLETIFSVPLNVLRNLPQSNMWDLRMTADNLNLYFQDPLLLELFQDPNATLYAWNRYYEAIQTIL